MSTVKLRMIVPLETAGADLGDTFAFGGFRCEATDRNFYCGQAFPLSLLEKSDWKGQVHCPFCNDFHETAASEETIRHAPVAAEVSDERDGRRTVSFRLPRFQSKQSDLARANRRPHGRRLHRPLRKTLR